MSASAIRMIRLAARDDGQDTVVQARRHVLSPLDAVERCVECGRRLAPGRHDLCPRCDAAAFEAAWQPQEVAL